MTILIETEEKYLPAFKALAKAVSAKIRVQNRNKVQGNRKQMRAESRFEPKHDQDE